MPVKATFFNPATRQRKAYVVGQQPAGWQLERHAPTASAPAAAKPFDYTELAKQFAAAVAPQQAPRPTFDQSGLYNEADVKAQANAEFDPYFQEQGQNLTRDITREAAARLRQQKMDTGGMQSDYLNRGLSKSGSYKGAQADLEQQQNLANIMGQESGVQRQKDLTQKKAGALEDYRTRAYNLAYQRYLGQFQ